MIAESSATSQRPWGVEERLRSLVWENATGESPTGGLLFLRVKALGSGGEVPY